MMGDSRPCVFLFANRGYALTNSRQRIIESFLASGWRVVIGTTSDIDSRSLMSIGADLVPIEFVRGGASIVKDVLTLWKIYSALKKFRPVLIHNFNSKPVIMSSVIARIALSHNVKVVNTITGLGHAFIQGGFNKHLAGFGYSFALRGSSKTIFQNSDDMQLFFKAGWVSRDNAVLIVGSGVDISRFYPAALHLSAPADRKLRVVMLGRLLWQKGVAEFVQVANTVRALFPLVEFIWAGELDSVHPDAVPAEWIRKQHSIQYVGRITEVAQLLQTADLVLFPSYREGVPRAVMEAAATGVAVVAFDVPGVREAVIPSVTGELVAGFDTEALSQSVIKLLSDRQRLVLYGKNARKLAEERFNVERITLRHFDLYRSLGIAGLPRGEH